MIPTSRPPVKVLFKSTRYLPSITIPGTPVMNFKIGRIGSELSAGMVNKKMKSST